jgi:hypothetical protein
VDVGRQLVERQVSRRGRNGHEVRAGREIGVADNGPQAPTHAVALDRATEGAADCIRHPRASSGGIA